MEDTLFNTAISIVIADWCALNWWHVGELNYPYSTEKAITSFTDENNWKLSVHMCHNHQDKVET